MAAPEPRSPGMRTPPWYRGKTNESKKDKMLSKDVNSHTFYQSPCAENAAMPRSHQHRLQESNEIN